MDMISPIRVAILGATGYGGAELLRWLSGHSAVKIVAVSSESSAGQPLARVFPHLGQLNLTLQPANEAQFSGDPQVVFCALPNGQAMQLAGNLLERGALVIDFSADFRLKEQQVFEQYYKMPHAAAHLLSEAVYGLPELYRDAIKTARLIANPGCYPTSALLALAPLLRAGIIQPTDIIIDSKSGVSGAGRTALKTPYLLAEANEDVAAYNISVHRHTPEIAQQLSGEAGRKAEIVFTPHLIPMTRGIFTTAYAVPVKKCKTSEILDIYRETYTGSDFITVLDEETLPHTKWCSGSNRAFVTARVDSMTGRVIALAAIDNLGKGMSGQAVQNMNLACGLPESSGLTIPAIYP
jgi:N-acetyl-gamma-glutamyl-phosphate reductase